MKHPLTGQGGKGSSFRSTNMEAYGRNLEIAQENTRRQREERIAKGCEDPNKILCSCDVCKASS